MFNLNFYFSLASVLTSVAAGAYFLVYWFSTGRKDSYLLWWALGFFVLYIFKIPNVLINAGFNIVQTDMYPILFFGLLLYLISHFALVKGLAHWIHNMNEPSVMGFFAVMFFSAVIYLYLTFFVPGGTTNAPAWGSNALFYIPIQIFILYKLGQATKDVAESYTVSHVSLILTSLGMLALVASSILYIVVQVRPYSRMFWYLAVVNTPLVSIVQVAAIVLLFFGFHSFLQNKSREETVNQ